MKNEQNMADSQTKSSIAFIKIEDNEIPALKAGSEIYFAVKMVEGKVLRHFPNIIPENVPPLTVVPLSPKQIELLNNISIRRNMKFDPLVTGDSMVKVQDFINFYVAIKQRYPHCAEAMKNFAHKSVQLEDKHDQCGWLLINTSVVPYILHDDSQYLPLEVLKQSVNLDVPSKISNLLNEKHCRMINVLCKSLNTSCTFAVDTKYVPLHFVLDFCDEIIVQKLDVPAGENPHGYAKTYIYNHTSSTSSTTNTRELSAASVSGEPPQTSCEIELAKSSTATNLSSQALSQLNLSNSRKRSLSPVQTSLSKRQSLDLNSIRRTSSDSIVPISQTFTSASTQHVRSQANISMVKETEISAMESTVPLIGNTQSLSVDTEHISKESILKKVSTDWSSKFKRIKITGKSILSIIRDDNKSYILVEPFARLFFPHIKLEDFVFQLEEIVPFLCVCIVDEENQFKKLYGIPVTHTLKCNKLIDLEALQKCLPLLFKTFQKPVKPQINKLKDTFIEID